MSNNTKHIILKRLYNTCKYTRIAQKTDLVGVHLPGEIYQLPSFLKFHKETWKEKKKKEVTLQLRIKIFKDWSFLFKRKPFPLYNHISPVTHKRHGLIVNNSEIHFIGYSSSVLLYHCQWDHENTLCTLQNTPMTDSDYLGEYSFK